MAQYELNQELPTKLLGNLEVNTVVGAGFALGETVTGGTSGATGVVVSVDGDTIIMNNIVGIFSVAETVTGGTSSTTATTVRFDLSFENDGIVRTLVYGSPARTKRELLISIRNLTDKIVWRTDVVTAPTLTASFSTDGTPPGLVTGNTMTVLVESNEYLEIDDEAYVEIDINGTIRMATYAFDQTEADALDYKFNYVLTAEDTATAGQVSIGNSVQGVVYDIVARGEPEEQKILVEDTSYTAPNVSTITVN